MSIEVLNNAEHPYIDRRIEDKGEDLKNLSWWLDSGFESVIETIVIADLHYHYIYKSNAVTGYSYGGGQSAQEFVSIIVTDDNGNLVDALNDGSISKSFLWSGKPRSASINDETFLVENGETNLTDYYNYDVNSYNWSSKPLEVKLRNATDLTDVKTVSLPAVPARNSDIMICGDSIYALWEHIEPNDLHKEYPSLRIQKFDLEGNPVSDFKMIHQPNTPGSNGLHYLKLINIEDEIFVQFKNERYGEVYSGDNLFKFDLNLEPLDGYPAFLE